MIQRLIRVALVAVATVPIWYSPVGGADPHHRDLHRECAELVWEDGGRVIDPDGTSRPPASLEELLTLPGYCPELSTELLHPSGEEVIGPAATG